MWLGSVFERMDYYNEYVWDKKKGKYVFYDEDYSAFPSNDECPLMCPLCGGVLDNSLWEIMENE